MPITAANAKHGAMRATFLMMRSSPFFQTAAIKSLLAYIALFSYRAPLARMLIKSSRAFSICKAPIKACRLSCKPFAIATPTGARRFFSITKQSQYRIARRYKLGRFLGEWAS